MGESGGSAQRKAEDLLASGDAAAAAWAAGAEGERRVAEALGALGEPWVVLHDRLLRPGLTESNLDHVVVGPAGVVLVDAKNWGGDVTEWNGGLYQHRWDAEGRTTHESKHAEVAKVHAMGREMAARLAVPVTPVLCLASSRAGRFGEARQVRGIWVVPVGGLVEWVRSRARAVDDDALGRLATLVMTEFPSTTTDPALLAAIGADLARGQASRRSSRRRMTGSAGPWGGGRRPTRGPVRATRRRRRDGVIRPLVALLVFAGLWWGLSHGLIQWFAEAGAGVTRSVLGVKAPTPIPTPDRLSCTDFDPKSVKSLRTTSLTATPASTGCDWYTTDAKGRRMLALRIRELTGTMERLDPMLKRSDAAGRSEVAVVHTLSGEATALWVRAGVLLSAAKDAPAATRSIHVQVSHALLGLSRKDGQRLATSIAVTASSHHQSLPQPRPTPSPRS